MTNGPNDAGASRLLASLADRRGLLAVDREWTAGKRWGSFSAEFVLFESGEDSFVIKVGNNWSSDDVSFVVDEIGRVRRLLSEIPNTGLTMPGVLGATEAPPAIALEYLAGEPIFDALPSMVEVQRHELLVACGQAIGAFHSAQTSAPMDESVGGARDALASAARKVGFRSAVAERRSQSLACARAFRFSPNDFLVRDDGTIVLLDPPHVRKYEFVHRDLGTFVMELHRSLLGERKPGTQAESAEFEAALNAFLAGYTDTGPSNLAGPNDMWAIWVFATARILGVAVNRFRQLDLRQAMRACAWAFALRRRAKEA